MSILIVGAGGMLGHKLVQVLSPQFETVATMRGVVSPALRDYVYKDATVVESVAAEDFASIEAVVMRYRPACVLNCIGIIKQRKEVDPEQHAAINGRLPHQLSELCARAKARLIHFSTDCVFNGTRGHYSETDAPDAEDVYGRSKRAGEIEGGDVLTLRTSFIGRELAGFRSLLEWVLARAGETVSGYRRSLFSGVTVPFLATIVRRIIQDHPSMSGLYHIAGPAISKHDLLCAIRDAYGLNLEIIPVDGPECNRTLNGNRFKSMTGIVSPEWSDLLRELAKDPTPYDLVSHCHEAM